MDKQNENQISDHFLSCTPNMSSSSSSSETPATWKTGTVDYAAILGQALRESAARHREYCAKVGKTIQSVKMADFLAAPGDWE